MLVNCFFFNWASIANCDSREFKLRLRHDAPLNGDLFRKVFFGDNIDLPQEETVSYTHHKSPETFLGQAWTQGTLDAVQLPYLKDLALKIKITDSSALIKYFSNNVTFVVRDVTRENQCLFCFYITISSHAKYF